MAARKVLDRFLSRAFRRPVAETETDRYVGLFADAQKRGESYELSIRYALQGALLSPNFLFRYEPPNSDAKPRLIGDYALASRLSYFLWGSMPDDTLFDLASKAKLQDPEVLRAQIARMLKDNEIARLRREVCRAMVKHTRTRARHQAGCQAVP